MRLTAITVGLAVLGFIVLSKQKPTNVVRPGQTPIANAAEAAPDPTPAPSMADREAEFLGRFEASSESVRSLKAELAAVERSGEGDLALAASRVDELKAQLVTISDSTLLQRSDVRHFREDVLVLDGTVSRLRQFAEHPDPRTDIMVEASSWSKDGFGTVAVWKLTLRNTNPMVQYADIEYKTAYSAPSGTLVGSGEGKILEILGPNQRKTFEVNDGFIDSRASGARLTISGAARVQRVK